MFKKRICKEARNLRKEALRKQREDEKYQVRMKRIMKDLVDIIDSIPASRTKVPQKHDAPMEAEFKYYELSKRLVRALDHLTQKEFQDMWGEYSPVYMYVRRELDGDGNLVGITVSTLSLVASN